LRLMVRNRCCMTVRATVVRHQAGFSRTVRLAVPYILLQAFLNHYARIDGHLLRSCKTLTGFASGEHYCAKADASDGLGWSQTLPCCTACSCTGHAPGFTV
jgi:hypothetical protein